MCHSAQHGSKPSCASSIRERLEPGHPTRTFWHAGHDICADEQTDHALELVQFRPVTAARHPARREQRRYCLRCLPPHQQESPRQPRHRRGDHPRAPSLPVARSPLDAHCKRGRQKREIADRPSDTRRHHPRFPPGTESLADLREPAPTPSCQHALWHPRTRCRASPRGSTPGRALSSLGSACHEDTSSSAPHTSSSAPHPPLHPTPPRVQASKLAPQPWQPDRHHRGLTKAQCCRPRTSPCARIYAVRVMHWFVHS
mmetsp:Transcript_55466/g.102605  ORF Transcript_55466/g.102605 Transcript_55466/m.102605 type:complete len:257 (-) Transcript_55466:510-1280(-)